MALPQYCVPKRTRLERMIRNHWGDNSGIIRFKYYGEFDVIKRIHDDCQDDLTYIGNSNLDGAPIFVFNYNDIKTDTIKDFKELNLILRKIKIIHYSKKQMTKKERSILTFFKFFMIAHDNYEIKGLNEYEIRYIKPHQNTSSSESSSPSGV